MTQRQTRLWITPARAGKTSMVFTLLVVLKDHPRACGENGSGRGIQWVTCGSPPRVRGKQDESGNIQLPDRITPARAGKTRSPSPPTCEEEDHPRACGENYLHVFPPLRLAGSPPRVRGKLADLVLHRRNVGITPARAGKTSELYKGRNRSQDHPRACGENLRIDPNCPANCGSPPRVRGKPSCRRAASKTRRITPARAGKTDPAR